MTCAYPFFGHSEAINRSMSHGCESVLALGRSSLIKDGKTGLAPTQAAERILAAYVPRLYSRRFALNDLSRLLPTPLG